jgi:spore photoproduct lyase
MRIEEQLDFWETGFPQKWGAHHADSSMKPPTFPIERIMLTKGSLDTPARERIVRRICDQFPDAVVEEQLDTPHNRVGLGDAKPLDLHATGKRTLVLGVLKSAVRFSEESDSICPNYWHYSVYGYCPFNCSYCYLAGTQGVRFSPALKIYVNLDEIMAEMHRIAMGMGKPVSFYHGKLQDGLALEPIAGFMQQLIPFFAQHPFARHILLTKSTVVDSLLSLEHGGRTTLSWSLNPPAIASRFESDTPAIQDRIQAMQRCAEAGYPIRANLMPLIPCDHWERDYSEFVQYLVSAVPLQKLTLGGICNYRQSHYLMEQRLGSANPISKQMDSDVSESDRRRRYAPELRIKLYNTIIKSVRAVRDDLPIRICMEEEQIQKALCEKIPFGDCTCVL